MGRHSDTWLHCRFSTTRGVVIEQRFGQWEIAACERKIHMFGQSQTVFFDGGAAQHGRIGIKMQEATGMAAHFPKAGTEKPDGRQWRNTDRLQPDS